MKVQELFNIGNEFFDEGRVETAMEIWNKVIARDTLFGPVYLNQHNVFRSQGNLVKAKECLIRFLNCPITGMSIDMIPAVRNQLADLEKQLTPPQPTQPAQPPK